MLGNKETHPNTTMQAWNSRIAATITIHCGENMIFGDTKAGNSSQARPQQKLLAK